MPKEYKNIKYTVCVIKKATIVLRKTLKLFSKESETIIEQKYTDKLLVIALSIKIERKFIKV